MNQNINKVIQRQNKRIVPPPHLLQIRVPRHAHQPLALPFDLHVVLLAREDSVPFAQASNDATEFQDLSVRHI